MKKTLRNSIILCGIGLLGFTSCKKDVVEIPESNDPIFRTEGTFGSENFEIIAGDNGAYMFTMTEVQNGVNVFSGKISNGNFSVELGIYDGHIDMPAYDALNELLNLTPIFSANDSTPLVTLSKSMLSTMSGSQYI